MTSKYGQNMTYRTF